MAIMPKKKLKVQFSSTSFVGKKIQGHYEKGNNKESWYTGTIQYFNKKLLEYYVKFADGTFDYIKISVIVGIDIVLLDP